MEGLYAPDASPVMSLMAEAGAAALITSLEELSALNRDDAGAASSGALYGAWLCGAVLGGTTMSLHHKICHVLGGTFGLPHGAAHTVMLPYVLAYNAPAAPAARESLQRATGSGDPAAYLQELSGRLGAPSSLTDIGFAPDDIERAVQMIVSNPYANPRPVTAPDIRTILTAATHGRPTTDMGSA